MSLTDRSAAEATTVIAPAPPMSVVPAPPKTARSEEVRTVRKRRPLWRILLPWVTTIALILIEEILARQACFRPPYRPSPSSSPPASR